MSGGCACCCGPRQHAISFFAFFRVVRFLFALRCLAAHPALDAALDATLALLSRKALPQHVLRTPENYETLSQGWPQHDHGVPRFLSPKAFPNGCSFCLVAGRQEHPLKQALSPRLQSLMIFRWSDRSRTLCLAPEVQKFLQLHLSTSAPRTLRPRHQLPTSQLQILPPESTKHPHGRDLKLNEDGASRYPVPTMFNLTTFISHAATTPMHITIESIRTM